MCVCVYIYIYIYIYIYTYIYIYVFIHSRAHTYTCMHLYKEIFLLLKLSYFSRVMYLINPIRCVTMFRLKNGESLLNSFEFPARKEGDECVCVCVCVCENVYACRYLYASVL